MVSHNSQCMQPDDHSTEPYGINIERLLVIDYQIIVMSVDYISG